MGSCSSSNKYIDDKDDDDDDDYNMYYTNVGDLPIEENTHPVSQDTIVSSMMCESLRNLIEKALRLFV